MLIDLLWIVLLVMAAYKGYERGLIVGIFSFLAVVMGLAAAIKLSVLAAQYGREHTKLNPEWIPLISFAFVFLGVLYLVRAGARLIEKVVTWVMLSWLNKAGGVLLYVAMYALVYGVFLFYLTSMGVLHPTVVQQSISYDFLQRFAPRIIEGMAGIIPVFNNLFSKLEQLFSPINNPLLIQ